MDISGKDLTPLYDGAVEIVRLYREGLEREKVNASGSLSRSADFDFDFNENDIALYFIYNPYGYYVDEGRKPTGGGAGQPWNDSVGDIIHWLDNKIGKGSFVPKNGHQIPRTEKEKIGVAHAIVHKIHTQGFYGSQHEGKHILEKAVRTADENGIIQKMVDCVAQWYDREVSLEIEKL
jgi:hypothetical protein